MSEAELITDDIVQQSELMPRVSDDTIMRMRAAVQRIAAYAPTYKCETAEDYEKGGREIVIIREQDTLWGNIYAPLKAFWSGRHKKVCAEEAAERAPLDAAKRLIGAQRIAWEAAEKKKQDALRRALETQEGRRAEGARLAQTAASGG